MPVVKTTDESIALIQQFSATIAGDVVPAIDALNRQARDLTTPEKWQGRHADRFRDDIWPSTHAALVKARESLIELQREIEQINRRIMEAGGN